jgi:hypothetical protein
MVIFDVPFSYGFYTWKREDCGRKGRECCMDLMQPGAFFGFGGIAG